MKAVCPRCRQRFPFRNPQDGPTFSFSAPAASTSPGSPSADHGQATKGEQAWSREFFLSTLLKVVLLLPAILSAVLVLAVFLFLLVGDLSSFEVKITLASLLTVLTASIALSIWRVVKPVLKVSAEGLKVNLPLICRVDFVKWEDVEGLVVHEAGPALLREARLKILLRSEGTATQEIVFSLKAIEKPDEVLALLREMVPERKGAEVSSAFLEPQPPARTNIRFGKFHLSESGIEGLKGHIGWAQVKGITCPPFVLAGFGATTLTYEAGGGKENRLVFQPKLSPNYQEFVRVLVYHSRNAASVDPALAKMLAYPPQEARLELAAIGLALSGILLMFGSMYFIDYFAPVGIIREIYVLLPLFLGLVPGAMAIITLASRFQGQAVPARKKVFWAGIFNLSPVAAVAILFLFSPFSLHYSLGYFNATIGQIQAAEPHYQTAYALRSDHPCLAFDIGLLYREQENHVQAFEFFEKAYELDPSYWGAAALELIPDSLMKMGEYEKGLERCETIMQKHWKNKGIVQALSIKKNEILQLKSRKPAVPEEE